MWMLSDKLITKFGSESDGLAEHLAVVAEVFGKSWAILLKELRRHDVDVGDDGEADRLRICHEARGGKDRKKQKASERRGR